MDINKTPHVAEYRCQCGEFTRKIYDNVLVVPFGMTCYRCHKLMRRVLCCPTNHLGE